MFQPIKVLIVDDNLVVRKMISDHLETVIGIEVISTANNGISGIEKWHRYNPEVILSDLEMPGKDGYDMSMDILKEGKDVAIIVVSALSNQYAERVLDMVSNGVSDYILKPSDIAGGTSKEEFWRSLSELVLTHGQIIQNKRGTNSEAPPTTHSKLSVSNKSHSKSAKDSTPDHHSSDFSTVTPAKASTSPPSVKKTIPTAKKEANSQMERPSKIATPSGKPTISKGTSTTGSTNKYSNSPFNKKDEIISSHHADESLFAGKPYNLVKPQAVLPPKLLAIGSSTGGPAALTTFLKELKRCGLRTDVPVFITQHMPPIFTARLADQLTMNTGFQVIEAQENMVVENGKFYLAPGDFHMHLGTSADGQNNVIRLKQTPKVNFCRPAVDEMLDSLVKKYKASQMLTVILTGMGSDGKKSCIKLRESGGTIFAQNEETSAVWGMPGAVATANICSVVSPLDELARKTVKYMKEARI